MAQEMSQQNKPMIHQVPLPVSDTRFYAMLQRKGEQWECTWPIQCIRKNVFPALERTAGSLKKEICCL